MDITEDFNPRDGMEHYGIPPKPVEGVTRYGPDVYRLVQELQEEVKKLRKVVKQLEGQIERKQDKPNIYRYNK